MSLTVFEMQQNVDKQMEKAWPNLSFSEIKDMLVLGLAGEAGEVADIRKKELRGYRTDRDAKAISRDHMTEELGDVLWYLLAVCNIYGIFLEDVWELNLAKLEERYGTSDN